MTSGELLETAWVSMTFGELLATARDTPEGGARHAQRAAQHPLPGSLSPLLPSRLRSSALHVRPTPLLALIYYFVFSPY